MQLTIEKGDGTTTTVNLMWKRSANSNPPTKPKSYNEDYSENPEDAWAKHPLLARNGFSFVSASCDDGPFSNPVVVDVALDPT